MAKDGTYTVLPTSPSGYEDVVFEGEIYRVPSGISRWGKQHGGKTRITNIMWASVLAVKLYILILVVCTLYAGGLPFMRWALIGFVIWAVFLLTASLMWIRLRTVVAGLALMAACCAVMVGLLMLIN